MTTKTNENYIEHEVRIRLLESIQKDTRNLIRGLLGGVITIIVMPIILHHYGLV